MASILVVYCGWCYGTSYSANSCVASSFVFWLLLTPVCCCCCFHLISPKGKVFDETSWTNINFCKSQKIWYPMSKTLAEKKAWEFAWKNGVDVVAIHPATSLGPFPQPYMNASGALLHRLLKSSKDTQENYWLGAVHVKDVADAQVLLFESPTASGRCLCTNGIFQFAVFAEKVSKHFPEFPIHRFNGETQPGLVACENAVRRLMD